MESIEGRLVGSKGAHRIDVSTEVTGLEKTVILAETDVSITTCSGTDEQGGAVDFTAAPYNWTSLVPGIPYAAEMGHTIETIQLTSGSVACY